MLTAKPQDGRSRLELAGLVERRQYTTALEVLRPNVEKGDLTAARAAGRAEQEAEMRPGMMPITMRDELVQTALRRERNRMAMFLATLALISCDGGTAVKYENCDRSGNDCLVTARFSSFESCEWYREIQKLVAMRHGCEARGDEVVCRLGSSLGLVTTRCVRRRCDAVRRRSSFSRLLGANRRTVLRHNRQLVEPLRS